MNLPIDTVKNQIVAINGIPKVVCRVAPSGPLELRPQYDRKVVLYASAGLVTTDYCLALSAELPTRSVCCERILAIVPVALVGQPEGTNIFTENHPNNGAAIVDLALAGTVFVGTIAEDESCVSPGYWDNIVPELPAGYGFASINVATPGEAAAFA
jgi:hypothetical protein